MGKNKGKLGWIDSDLEAEMERVRNKAIKLNIDFLSDRQASKIIAGIARGTDYELRRKIKKRKKEIIISLQH